MKLEEIKKKNIYTVPDKYFDQLPSRIQSRVNVKRPVLGIKLSWSLALKVATPAIAIIVFLFYFGINNNNNLSAEDLIAQVSTEDLIAYLETTDITTDEIIEELDLTNIDLDFYDDGPIMQDMEMDDLELELLLDEYGIESEFL